MSHEQEKRQARPERQERSAILVTRDGAVGTVTINRPDKLNAFTPTMKTEKNQFGAKIITASTAGSATAAVRTRVLSTSPRSLAGSDRP